MEGVQLSSLPPPPPPPPPSPSPIFLSPHHPPPLPRLINSPHMLKFKSIFFKLMTVMTRRRTGFISLRHLRISFKSMRVGNNPHSSLRPTFNLIAIQLGRRGPSKYHSSPSSMTLIPFIRLQWFDCAGDSENSQRNTQPTQTEGKYLR